MFPNTTLIVVGYNCSDDDLEYLDSLAPSFADAVFVNNGSKEPLGEPPTWTILRPDSNLGFGVGANLASKCCDSELLYFLNPDIRLKSGALELLHAALAVNPVLAASGPTLAPANSLIEANAGGAAKTLPNALVFAFLPGKWLPSCQIWRSKFPRSPTVTIDWLSGASMLVRRVAFEQVGGFPPDYFLYDEDVELGSLIRTLGHTLCVVPAAIAHHRVAGSQTGDQHYKQWALSNQRHVYKNSNSRVRALVTLILIQVGLWRRVFWKSFLGTSEQHLYAGWSAVYLCRYGHRLPATKS